MSTKRYISVIAACVGVIGIIVCCIALFGEDGRGDSHGRYGVGGIPTTTVQQSSDGEKRYNTEEIVVVTAVDTVNEKITVRRIDESAEFVLSYNGGTVIKSKYGNQLLAQKISIGEIARVCYVSGIQKLIEFYEYGDAWENTMATRWDVDYDKKLITIGSSTYFYDDNIFIVSNGKSIDIREISRMDELTVRGLGNKVHSVCVDKGHGFVKLTNTVNYVGGIVEIGDRITAIISADMIIAAPEGEFEVTATINGVGGSKTVTVVRGKETVVSLGSFEQSVTRYGTVKLTVSPNDAQAVLTVDGVEMDYSEHLSLSYGKHKIVLTSNNYDTVTKEITISSVYSTININMGDETETESTPGEEPTTVGGEEATTEKPTDNNNSGSSNNLICVTAPDGAKVYFDGAYVGVSPISFEKVPGEHEIIFKKDGFITKSYTIDVSDDTDDMILSFPAMMEE